MVLFIAVLFAPGNLSVTPETGDALNDLRRSKLVKMPSPRLIESTRGWWRSQPGLQDTGNSWCGREAQTGWETLLPSFGDVAADCCGLAVGCSTVAVASLQPNCPRSTSRPSSGPYSPSKSTIALLSINNLRTGGPGGRMPQDSEEHSVRRAMLTRCLRHLDQTAPRPRAVDCEALGHAAGVASAFRQPASALNALSGAPSPVVPAACHGSWRYFLPSL